MTMTDTQAQEVMSAYQRLVWRKEEELARLRELRRVVNLFLNRYRQGLKPLTQ
jgi:hypothetical protein